MSNIEWSPQQDNAIKTAQDWLKEPNGKQVFYLAGYAGTGKTTLAKEIAGSVDGDVMYGAYTGKAASVMRRKGCKGASTIHSMIYKIEDETETDQPRFIINRESDVKEAKLVIIDEISMVDQPVGEDLLSFGTKVLVIGDPAQLPPVTGSGYFTEKEPDVMMTEVHRQARDNPIIRMSMLIRQGGKLEPGTYGESRVVERADIEQDELAKLVLDADQVIVGLNRTRQAYNRRIRQLIGREGPMPVKGDKLVCLRNDKSVGVFNGTLWEVDHQFHPKVSKKRKTIPPGLHLHICSTEDEDRVREKDVRVLEQFFLGTEGDLQWQDKRGSQEFTYGYALTCHKSQGSQWNQGIVFDESAAFRDSSRAWLYTAVTRFAERLTLVV